MKSKKKTIYDGAAPLPIMLYLISICAALMYALCRSRFLLCAGIMSALTAGIFLLFYKVRFRPLTTTLAIFAQVLAAWGVGYLAMMKYSSDANFMKFLFTASASFDWLYAAAAIIIFSVIIGFIGCYFSVINPQPCFLMLLSFIPLILSFRTARELPVYFTIIMAACFIFACQNLAVPVPSDGAAVFTDRSSRRKRTALSCAAAVIVGLVAAILPRFGDEPVLDTLDSLTGQQYGYFNTSGMSNFASRSSVNNGNNTPTGSHLFTVKTDSPGYLTRWVFDIYDEDGWQALEYFNEGSSGWEYNMQSANITAFLDKLLENADKLTEQSREIIENARTYGDNTAYTEITICDGSSSRVIIHPTNTYRVWLPEDCGRTYRTTRNDIFTENIPEANLTYGLEHYSSAVNADFLRSVDRSDMELLLSDAYFSDIITWSQYSALMEELDYAYLYYDICESFSGETLERIQELADSITAGCTSDYEKAAALEKWFGDEGFVYDMSFAPEEKGVEYFLFESRRGICSDYATALTLLARAAGLPARYCEGFAVTSDTYDEETGLYNITDEQAHAWPQIYISGAGWLDFDATRYAVIEEESQAYMLWIYIAAGAVVLLIVAFVFRKPLGWAAFCVSYPFRSGESRIRGVYLRTRKIAAELAGADENALSSGEVGEILTNRLDSAQQAEKICSAADALFYSPNVNADGKALLKELKIIKKRRRRCRRK